MHITFSHRYPKLHDQKTATLLSICVKNRMELSDSFIEYDTVYAEGHYPLPDGRYMVLVFLGNDLIPFTTARSYTDEKFVYYISNVGEVFGIRYASSKVS